MALIAVIICYLTDQHEREGDRRDIMKDARGRGRREEEISGEEEGVNRILYKESNETKTLVYMII